MTRFSSIEHKLLLVFAAFLLAITVLNAALTSYVINRRNEADAFARLSQQLVLFQKELESSRANGLAVAVDAAGDEKNLSDLATLYGQALKLDQEPGAALESTLSLNKLTSLNRLQLILHSARLTSAAVYLKGDLSHYVTRDAAGMTVQRDQQSVLIGTRQKESGKVLLAERWNWSSGPPPSLIAPRLPVANRVTVSFDFPTRQTMTMRVIVPIQGAPRESFHETIVENLTIAAEDTTSPPTGNRSTVIGMFVFSKVFDLSFLEETAAKTGMMPAIFAADGLQRAQLVEVGAPPEPVPARNGTPIRLQTVDVGPASYYQAFMPWRPEPGGTDLTLSLALSRENTLITIGQTVAGIVAVAVFILLIGGAIGYVLIARLVAPIKTLAATVSSTVLNAAGEGAGPRATIHPPDHAAEIDLGARDEVARLTAAFNVMTRQLRQSLETLEQRVDERTKQLEATNKELEAFAYSVSHDLRAPLRHIDGFLALLRDKIGTQLDEQSQHYMTTISGAAERMGALINDLLSFSRMGRQKLVTARVDLGTLIQDVIHELEPETSGRTIRWHIAKLPVVTGDRAMLRVVLVNLISNAVKFTRPREQAEIWVDCLPAHETETIVFVRDNGVGFDMQYGDKLFGVFERLHGVEEFEGTGIGLANVRRVIERHGGRTWAEGEVDRGATFYFSLPLAPSGTPPEAPELHSFRKRGPQ